MQGTLWREYRNNAAYFLALLLITVAYQTVYCHVLTGGDPAGLFFAGASFHRPAELGGFVYSGFGYDGQMYRLVAHDPLNRKGYWKLLDDPRYRSRRILVPALAALLGGRSPWRVDLSYVAVVDILLALGGVCFIRLAGGCCPPLAALALYVFLPSMVASTDRMVVDGPLVAGILAAWLFYRDRRTGALMGVLALLPVVRETGVCFTGGVALAYLAGRRYCHAAATAATVLPASLWWWYVALQTKPSSAASLLSTPLIPQVLRLFQVYHRPVAPAVGLVIEMLDSVACACLLVALGWFAVALAKGVCRRQVDEDVLLIAPLALLAVISSSRPIMEDPYAFMRVDTPLLIWAALRFMRTRLLYAALYVPASSAGLLIFRASPLFRLLGG